MPLPGSLESRVSRLEGGDETGPDEDLEGRVSQLESETESECIIDPKKRFGIKCPAWSASVFGRLYIDTVAFSEDNHREEDSGAGLKDISNIRIQTARIGIVGNYQNTWGFEFEADIPKTTQTRLRDAYATYISTRGFQVRVGKTKVPYSLEVLTNSKFLTFMERVLPEQISPERTIGLVAFYGGRNRSLGAAVHGEGHDRDANPDTYQADWGATFRGSWAPLYKKDRHYLHLGVGIRHVNFPSQDKTRVGFATRSPFSNAFDFKASSDAGLSVVDEVAGVRAGRYLECVGDDEGVPNRGGSCDRVAFEDLVGWNAELAGGYGPVGFKAQYIRSEVDSQVIKRVFEMNQSLPEEKDISGSDPAKLKSSYDFDTWYAEGNWWITGETNVYNPSKGTFGRVRPVNDVADGGIGAIGIAARYNRVDFGNRGDMGYLDCTNACKADAWTLNLTWKPNPYVKFMGEYVRVERQRVAAATQVGFEDKPTAFQMRAMIDF